MAPHTSTGEWQRRMTRSILGIALAFLVTAALISAEPDSSCAARSGAGVRWLRVAPSNEHAAIDRWCSPVGVPVRIGGRQPEDVLSGPVAIVSWNTHVGAGDLDGLVTDLRSGGLTGGRPVTSFVLLLQEVYRSGDTVPSQVGRDGRWASAQRPPGPGGERDDVAASAKRLGLEAFYAPSMRNGAPGATDEDRGNAILSTMPMSELTAIELPLERQRRVALQATVSLTVQGRAPVPLRVVSTHFTNMVMHHVWVLSESGRLRQARALASVLPADGPLVLAGDFNAWFGYRDAAYKELVRRVPAPWSDDRRATFGPMRLDHILTRLPEGWRASTRRAGTRYGSDHYPLVATIEPPPT
jgi:endonuclease/exonuclease/phosphatase family metal-dependent hydrolase